MSESEEGKSKSSRKRFRFVKVALVLVAGALAIVSLGIWYYGLSTSINSDILVLDKNVLTVVLDDLPNDDKEASSIAQESIINATGVPERAFSGYFRLTNASRTQFQWLLLYNVTGNPDLAVYLVRRISADEGFNISDDYIAGMVGTDYFNAHFKRKTFDSNAKTAYYSFSYLHSRNPGEIELSMWVKLGNDRSVIGQHMVTTPQEVEVSLEQAIETGRMNGLNDPLSGYPVLTDGVLCWRVVWGHKPTGQDYDAHTIYGVDVHCTTGEVTGKHRYVRPKPKPPPPIQVAQIASLIDKLGVEDLEDGAIIQLYVTNGSNEKFSVVKTFGRVVVKEGAIENADVTLWFDREIIVNALESEDVLGYLRANAGKGKVSVELHKNIVILQRKGYMSLYEKLK